MTRAQHMFLIGTEITLDAVISISSTTNFPQIDFNANGTITYKSNGIAGLAYPHNWYGGTGTFTGISSNYEIRLTPTAGSFATSATSTWLALTSGITWSRTAGDGTSTGTIEIRRASTQQLLGSCTLNLIDSIPGSGA